MRFNSSPNQNHSNVKVIQEYVPLSFIPLYNIVMKYYGYILFGLVALLFATMAWPFFQSIFFAAIFAISLWPVNELIIRKFKLPPNLAALLTVFVTFVFIVGPLVALLGLIAREAFVFAESIDIESAFKFFDRDALDLFGFEINLRDIFVQLQELLKNSSSLIMQIASDSLGAISRYTFLFFIFLLFFYYFLRDSQVIVNRLKKILPYKSSQQKRLMAVLHSTSKTLFSGYLFTALISGFLAFVGFLLFGIQGAIIWGLLAAIFSLIPTIGPLFVYIVGALFVGYFSGLLFAVLFILYYVVVQVLLLDTLIKPKLLDEKLAMHPLLVFIAFVGGILTMGSMGALYGPIIVVILVTMYEFLFEEKGKLM